MNELRWLRKYRQFLFKNGINYYTNKLIIEGIDERIKDLQAHEGEKQ